MNRSVQAAICQSKVAALRRIFNCKHRPRSNESNRLRRLNGLLFVLPLIFFLAACGSGSESSSASNPVSETTTTLSAGSSAVVVGSVTVDFSSQPALIGTQVYVKSAEDEAISASLEIRSAEVGGQSTKVSPVEIVIANRPENEGIKLTISIGSGMASPVALVLSTVDAEAGDGDESWTYLATTYDKKSGLLSAVIPPEAFEDEDGSYQVHIVIRDFSIASASLSTAHVASAESSTTTLCSGENVVSPSRPLLRCPVIGGCVERSQQSLLRSVRLGGETYSKPKAHKGVDLKATEGTSIISPVEGVVIGGMAKVEHKTYHDTLVSEGIDWNGCKPDFVDPSTGKRIKFKPVFIKKAKAVFGDSKKAESAWQAVCGAGVHVKIKSGSSILKFFHLSEIDPDLLSTAKALKIGYLVKEGDAIGNSGSTGVAAADSGKGGPHLHLEYWPDAKKPVDPFPMLINEFKMAVSPSLSLELDQANPNTVVGRALDNNLVLVESDVKNALEPYAISDKQIAGDPTRKLCFASSNNSLLDWTLVPGKLADSATVFAGPAGWTCIPWKSPLTVIGKSDKTDVSLEMRHTTNPRVAPSQDCLSANDARGSDLVVLQIPRHWAGRFKSTSCSSPPAEAAYGEWSWENPCFSLGPVGGSYEGFFYFDDSTPDVVLGSNLGIAFKFGTDDVRRVFRLNWKSSDNFFSYEIPTYYGLSGNILGTGKRSVVFTVKSRTASYMSGTFSVDTISGYFASPLRNPDSFGTIASKATGEWSAEYRSGVRPQTKMNGFDFCFSGNTATKQSEVGVGNPFAMPSWNGGFVGGGCVFQ